MIKQELGFPKFLLHKGSLVSDRWNGLCMQSQSKQAAHKTDICVRTGYRMDFTHKHPFHGVGSGSSCHLYTNIWLNTLERSPWPADPQLFHYLGQTLPYGKLQVLRSLSNFWGSTKNLKFSANLGLLVDEQENKAALLLPLQTEDCSNRFVQFVSHSIRLGRNNALRLCANILPSRFCALNLC